MSAQAVDRAVERPRVSVACLNGTPGCKGCDHPRHEARIAPRDLALAGRFGTVVVDPPWAYTYATRSTTTGGNGWTSDASQHYGVMSHADLLQLPIPAVAADDCLLALWCVNALLDEAVDLVRAWGFDHKGMVTWAKCTKDGTRPRAGMGYWHRGATEHLMIATVGKPKPRRRDLPTWFAAPPTKHSAKPEQVYDDLETLAPGPFLDVFARRIRPGWTVWGNEVWE